jgi:hypothetical protein
MATPRSSAEPATTAAAADEDEIPGWSWGGSDEFTALGDRLDAPPLPLPAIMRRKRVVLVRHGQSTWNARNRIQGSSNFSVLTEKGVGQAQAAHQLVRPWEQGPPPRRPRCCLASHRVLLAVPPQSHPDCTCCCAPPPPPPGPLQLAGWEFECMFYSPLQRAVQTSEIVWGGRAGPTLRLPCLREVDLYSFQACRGGGCRSARSCSVGCSWAVRSMGPSAFLGQLLGSRKHRISCVACALLCRARLTAPKPVVPSLGRASSTPPPPPRSLAPPLYNL